MLILPSEALRYFLRKDRRLASYLLLIFLWAAWSAVHSVMIWPSFAACAGQRLGPACRYYRILYNLIALVTFPLVLLYEHSLTGPAVMVYWGPLQYLRYVILLLSGFFFIGGARGYDLLQFLGIRQALSGQKELGLTEYGGLDTSGMRRVVRHPWYLAAILLIWSVDTVITTPQLITKICLTVYLVVGTRLEEQKLLHAFGEPYRRYQREVSMLFPVRWLVAFIKRGLTS